MVKIITSQHFLSDEIVEAKQAAADYSVMLSPVFEIDGDEFQVVLDGHHSLAAAIADGIDADYSVATQQDSDRVGLLLDGKVDDFLAVNWMDGEYIDAITRKAVW